jgi:hypothetical protein
MQNSRPDRRRLAGSLTTAAVLLAAATLVTGCRTNRTDELDGNLAALRDTGAAGFDARVLAAVETISEAELQRGIDELASDQMNGRHWKSPEGWMAAGWIAGRMSSIGLTPAAANGTWYDAFADHPDAAPNVIGCIPGTGDGIVLLTAHYDHLKTRENVEPGEDAIFNGADDNASGVTGILAAARALKQIADVEPFDATIMLIAFSGEEAGLRGARDIVADPPFALDRIVGMINCDMISRGGSNLLFIEGMPGAPGIASAIRRANAVVGLEIRADEYPDWLRRSDQGPFLRVGVPAVLFSVEDHPDYHQVTDHADRVDAGLAMRASRLAALAAHTLATGGHETGGVADVHLGADHAGDGDGDGEHRDGDHDDADHHRHR